MHISILLSQSNDMRQTARRKIKKSERAHLIDIFGTVHRVRDNDEVIYYPNDAAAAVVMFEGSPWCDVS